MTPERRVFWLNDESRLRPYSPGHPCGLTACQFFLLQFWANGISWGVCTEAIDDTVCGPLPDEARDSRRVSISGVARPGSSDFKLMAVSMKLGADSVEPSTPRELFPLPAVESGFSPYDTAADGQRFLVRATPQQQAAQPLTLIVNWPALLKKGAATQ